MSDTKQSPMIWIALAILTLGAIVVMLMHEPTLTKPGTPVQFTMEESYALGVVEGLTEFLPISSTGHLELVSEWMGMRSEELKDAVDAFNIVIQGAALLAIVGLYRKRVGEMINGIVKRDADGLRLLRNLFISFFPAAFIGLLFHKKIKAYLFNPEAIAGAMIVGGILMIVLELLHRRKVGTGGMKVAEVTWKVALIVGIAQIFSMWPGTSRSMATMLGAMLAGMSLADSAEYSFLLALPTLGAASVYDFAKSYHIIFQHASTPIFLIGMATSAMVAALAVKGFISFLQRGGLAPFGYYRIAAGIAVLFLISR